MWFERSISSKIRGLAGQYPAMVLTGARQVGKTSLLKKLFPDHSFVSLDLPSHAEMAETNPEGFLEKFSPPVIIDEVQYAPGIFRYLKSQIDENREKYGQYILTGSQKFTLMKSISDSLAGRCAVCELEGLSYSEIQAYKDLSVEELILSGGYPELHSRSELEKEYFFDSYLATYLERDIRALLKVGHLRDFERFVRACAIRCGQTLNKAELARDIGVSAVTANEWLSVLHASNQVILLEPWFRNKTKALVKSPKLYLADTGLLCHLLNIRNIEDLVSSPFCGAIWENYVFSEIRKRKMGSWKLWFWRDNRGLEVDFLSDRGGRYELLEVKWNEHPKKKDAESLRKVSDQLGLENIISAKIVGRTQASYKIQMNENLSVEVVGIEGELI